MKHLAIAPILVPLLTGAMLLLLERRHRIRVLRIGAWTGMTVLFAVAVALVQHVRSGHVVVYLLGDWPARLGIALTVDRTGALMVLTTTLLAIACLLHACSGWDRRALHFHALFQLQLMGLNGAFLTGDLFNLFVFFEVMLIASYGLLLSGGRGPRLRAGMHYVVFNVAASTLFLIALGLLYGLMGTLNMAELSARLAAVPVENAALVRAAGGMLLVVFCAKAAILPLYLWLPETYARAPVAVAALFTIMTKVGLYAVLRVHTLLFNPQAEAATSAVWGWLLPGGAATLLLATLGVIGTPRLRIGVAYLVLLSAGTLFVAFALATPGTIAAGLYYLPHSAFVTAALFMIADLIQRQRGAAGDFLFPIAALPAKTVPALLFLVAAVSVAGLPPLSGFVGKLMLLSAVPAEEMAWIWSVILGSGLLVLIGVSRMGTRLFWRLEPAPDGAPPPLPLRRGELAATVLLLGYGVLMTVAADPILRYTRAAAEQLLAPGDYVTQVRETPPVLREPSP